MEEQTKIRCLVMDLDGTALDPDGLVSGRTRLALEAAIAQGIQVVIASGRSFRTLPEDLLEIPGIVYAVTCNGASVYHVPTGRRVQGFLLPPEAVDKVLELTKGEPIAYEAFLDGVAYTDVDYVENPEKYAANAWVQDYVRRTRTIVPDMKEFLRQNRQNVDGIELVVADGKLKQELWRRLEANIPGIYITSSESTLIEVSRAGSGKQAGMAYVLDRLGLSPEETAAFGNGDNDAEMLSYAGLGVAVANASAGCLAAADLIAESNRSDGVAQVIERILAGSWEPKAFVYLLRCSDGTLYTGWTNDVTRRTRVHNQGKGAKYTKSRLPVQLVYQQGCSSKEAALHREWQIKTLSRKEKLDMVRRHQRKNGGK